MRFSSHLRLLLAATLLMSFACGGDDDDDDDNGIDSGTQITEPDATVMGPDGGGVVTPDAMPQPDATPPPPACLEFDTPAGTIDTFPGQVMGDLSSAVPAFFLANGDCATEEAPYGVGALGPDAVYALTGLTAGTTYVVKVTAGADLAFFVATGCSGETALSAGECLLFVDAQVSQPEQSTFVAPESGNAYVVVDYYSDSAPAPATFTLDVLEAECTADSECTAEGLPACVAGICRPCRDNFDCTNPEAPMCGVTAANECGAGPAVCVDDDEHDNNDDGPAGATDATPDETNTFTAAGNICAEPAWEADYFKVNVATAGEGFNIQLAWETEASDLDMIVIDEQNRILGRSWWENPEAIALTFMPTGTFYIIVNQYSEMPSSAVTAYTLTVTRVAGTTCSAVADCAAEHRNQVFRGSCTGGACVFIDGDAMVPVNSICDTPDDCEAGAQTCTAFPFNADADTRAFCAASCANDDECGEGKVCNTDGITSFCALPCTVDQHCPANLGGTPTGSPWLYAVCDTATGKCTL